MPPVRMLEGEQSHAIAERTNGELGCKIHDITTLIPIPHGSLK